MFLINNMLKKILLNCSTSINNFFNSLFTISVSCCISPVKQYFIASLCSGMSLVLLAVINLMAFLLPTAVLNGSISTNICYCYYSHDCKAQFNKYNFRNTVLSQYLLTPSFYYIKLPNCKILV